MKFAEIMDVLKRLASSQGFYGRLVASIEEMPEYVKAEYKKVLETQNFTDAVDVVDFHKVLKNRLLSVRMMSLVDGWIDVIYPKIGVEKPHIMSSLRNVVVDGQNIGCCGHIVNMENGKVIYVNTVFDRAKEKRLLSDWLDSHGRSNKAYYMEKFMNKTKAKLYSFGLVKDAYDDKPSIIYNSQRIESYGEMCARALLGLENVPEKIEEYHVTPWMVERVSVAA